MGYMRNHTIVVSDHGYGMVIEHAHARAAEIFPWVSPVSPPAVNHVRSFFIPPDGSKEGWSASDEGDARRAAFITILEACKYSDGSSPLSWIEVQYGDDEHENRITAANDMSREEAPDAS